MQSVSSKIYVSKIVYNNTTTTLSPTFVEQPYTVLLLLNSEGEQRGAKKMERKQERREIVHIIISPIAVCSKRQYSCMQGRAILCDTVRILTMLNKVDNSPVHPTSSWKCLRRTHQDDERQVSGHVPYLQSQIHITPFNFMEMKWKSTTMMSKKFYRTFHHGSFYIYPPLITQDHKMKIPSRTLIMKFIIQFQECFFISEGRLSLPWSICGDGVG